MPYLWTIMFRIDGESIHLTKEFQLEGEPLVNLHEGSHGNLKVEEVVEGQKIPIPQELGLWQTHLQPIEVPFFNYAIPGSLGVIAVLMLERNVSDDGADIGLRALQEFAIKAVNQSVSEFDVKHIDVENIQPSIKQYFATQVAKLEPGIESAVTKAIFFGQNILQNIWTVFDRDQLVGYKVWDIQARDLKESGGTISLEATWESEKLGTWMIEGEVRAV